MVCCPGPNIFFAHIYSCFSTCMQGWCRFKKKTNWPLIISILIGCKLLYIHCKLRLASYITALFILPSFLFFKINRFIDVGQNLLSLSLSISLSFEASYWLPTCMHWCFQLLNLARDEKYFISSVVFWSSEQLRNYWQNSERKFTCQYLH